MSGRNGKTARTTEKNECGMTGEEAKDVSFDHY